MLSSVFLSFSSLLTKATFVIIPILLVTPESKIHWYVPEATKQMIEAKNQLPSNPEFSYATTIRAEHLMTLSVSELHKIHDTSVVPYDQLFSSFQEQQRLLTDIRSEATEVYVQKFKDIEGFGKRNWNTAKLIYYNGVPPERPVTQSKLYTE